MELTRHAVLQAELARIEDEATARSVAVMNKADALFAAHQLCALINEDLPEHDQFEPHVVHHGLTRGCSILIYTHAKGALFLRRLAEHHLAWSDIGPTYSNHRELRVDGFPGVEVPVENEVVDAANATLQAAA